MISNACTWSPIYASLFVLVWRGMKPNSNACTWCTRLRYPFLLNSLRGARLRGLDGPTCHFTPTVKLRPPPSLFSYSVAMRNARNAKLTR
jgi:hypothetical protein